MSRVPRRKEVFRACSAPAGFEPSGTLCALAKSLIAATNSRRTRPTTSISGRAQAEVRRKEVVAPRRRHRTSLPEKIRGNNPPDDLRCKDCD